MTNIDIPVRKTIQGKIFYDSDMAQALASVKKAGFEPMFMPQLLNARSDSPNDSLLWKDWYTTPSIRATGKTKRGKEVVVYAHVPNYLSNPKNLALAKKNMVNGAGVIPNKDFQKMLDMEDGQNVFVVDYNLLKNSTSEVIPLKNAFAHPQTIPFCGGKENAERYLERFKEVYGEKIGIWHSDDLNENPLGRLLFVGSGCNLGLGGNDGLVNDGRFGGVHASASPRSGRAQVTRPSIDKIVETLDGDIAPNNVSSVKSKLEKLYKVL